MNTNYGFKTSLVEIIENEPAAHVQFFRELIDTTSWKCYAIQPLTESEIGENSRRLVGFYGQRVRTFTPAFRVQRGHTLRVIKASKRKPVTVFERIYASGDFNRAGVSVAARPQDNALTIGGRSLNTFRLDFVRKPQTQHKRFDATHGSRSPRLACRRDVRRMQSAMQSDTCSSTAVPMMP